MQTRLTLEPTEELPEHNHWLDALVEAYEGCLAPGPEDLDKLRRMRILISTAKKLHEQLPAESALHSSVARVLQELVGASILQPLAVVQAMLRTILFTCSRTSELPKAGEKSDVDDQPKPRTERGPLQTIGAPTTTQQAPLHLPSPCPEAEAMQPPLPQGAQVTAVPQKVLHQQQRWMPHSTQRTSMTQLPAPVLLAPSHENYRPATTTAATLHHRLLPRHPGMPVARWH